MGMQASLKKLEEHTNSLDTRFDRLMATSQCAESMAASLEEVAARRGTARAPLARIADSIGMLTDQLSQELEVCSRLQSAQIIGAFESASAPAAVAAEEARFLAAAKARDKATSSDP